MVSVDGSGHRPVSPVIDRITLALAAGAATLGATALLLEEPRLSLVTVAFVLGWTQLVGL